MFDFIHPQAVVASLTPTPSGLFVRVAFSHIVELPFAYMRQTGRSMNRIISIRVPAATACCLHAGGKVRLWVNENFMPRVVHEPVQQDLTSQGSSAMLGFPELR